jgi:hypothetical protein
MKYKTLFRLLLKAIGVWLFGSSLSQLVLYSTYLFQGFPSQPYVYLMRVLGPLLQIAFGLYLFFGGKWLADRAIPGNRPFCHECGYDLTGAVGNICVECGTPFAPPAQQNG